MIANHEPWPTRATAVGGRSASAVTMLVVLLLVGAVVASERGRGVRGRELIVAAGSGPSRGVRAVDRVATVGVERLAVGDVRDPVVPRVRPRWQTVAARGLPAPRAPCRG